MMTLRYLALGAFALTALAASAVPAFSADNGTVNAKVTVAAPCLTVSLTAGATQLDFGTTPFGGGSSYSNGISLTNCASAAENISARGTNATSTTSTASWTLQDSPRTCPSTPNVYVLATQAWNSDGTLTLGPGSATFLSTSDKPLVSGLSPGSRPVFTSISVPCPGSAGAGETMSFQFIYTASL